MMVRWLMALYLCASPAFAVQCALPVSDAGAVNFSEGVAGADGDTELWNEADEGVSCGGSPDDGSTYAISANNPNNTDEWAVNLASLSDPAVDTGHIIRVRLEKNASAGRDIDVRYRLEQGGATIHASCEKTLTAIANPWFTDSFTLPSTCSSAITNYTDLEVAFDCNVTGTGAGRACDITAVELEVPDAPAPSLTGQGLLLAPITY